jgi:hypothetical protein
VGRGSGTFFQGLRGKPTPDSANRSKNFPVAAASKRVENFFIKREASGMRALCFTLLALTCGAISSFATTAPSCPGGVPVSGFRLFVVPVENGTAIPLDAINEVKPGENVRYEPFHLPAAMKHEAKVTVLFVPSSDDSGEHIEVMRAQPADAPAEWQAPMRASVVGFIFGPHGLDANKINSLVTKNPELISNLTDYVEKTTKVETLVGTLNKFEQSAPGTSDLSSVLGHFSAQYGVTLPKLDSSLSSDQQANQLLNAVLPAFSADDPLSRPSLTVQSTGLAASVATMFFGGPQVALAAGGADLLTELHATLFPHAEFRSAFALPEPADGMSLCESKESAEKAQAAKSAVKTRLAYLWMLKIPDSDPPRMTLSQTVYVPAGWKSSVKVSCASVEQLKLVARARAWQIVSDKTKESIPVSVTPGSANDDVTLDLTRVKLPAGEYHLATAWDWTPIQVAGTVDVLPFGDYSHVSIAPEGRDKLVAGNGPVNLKLTGADFEFIDRMALEKPKEASEAVENVSFVLPKGKEKGVQQTVEASVNMNTLEPGNYMLQLKQLNGATHDVAITVHPPNPKLADLPIRVNLGEAEQTIHLRGTSLERIARITSGGATWKLDPVATRGKDLTERVAKIHLDGEVKEGERIAANVFVDDIQEPLQIPDLLEVAGPRPEITSVKDSFAAQPGIEMKKGEIPAESQVSFAILAKNAGASPILSVNCAEASDARQSLTLMPGEKDNSGELDLAGEGVLFLSLNPGEVGRTGCELIAKIENPATGESDPYQLGKVIRLPKIDGFTLSAEKVGDALYAGELTGEDLQAIEQTGWDEKKGAPVQGIPTPVPGESHKQTLEIAMPWPPPSPHAPLYVWIRGESEGRPTSIRY